MFAAAGLTRDAIAHVPDPRPDQKLLWIAFCVGLGYAMGQSAVDVAKGVSRYALYFTIGLIVLVFARQCWKVRAEA